MVQRLMLHANDHILSFSSTNELGAVAEDAVTRYMTAQGYKVSRCRIGHNQGIDRVSVRGDEVVAVEVKTNPAYYKPEQMSDTYLATQVKRMRASDDPLLKGTATRVESAIAQGRLTKYFFNPDFKTETMSVQQINSDGSLAEERRVFQSSAIQNVIRRFTSD